MPTILSKARNVYTDLNIKIGRTVYGNIANFSNNFLGNKRWEASKANHNYETTDKNAKELQETGVVVFKDLFPKDAVAEVYKEYLDVIENEQHCQFYDENGKIVGNKQEGPYRTVIKDPFKSTPGVKNLFTDKLLGFVKEYYQSEFSFYSVNLWRTEHISDEHLARIYPNQPYSILWHVDGHPIDTLKMFMVLSDVTEEEGPLHYLTIQRTKELLEKGYKNRFDYGMPKSELEDPAYLKKLTGSGGTLAFCNTTKCLHRAGVPAQGHFRDILEFQFESSPTPFTIPSKNADNNQY